MNILKNSTNVLGTEFKVIDALTGLPKSNLTSASGELQLWYYRKDKGKVNISLTDIQLDSDYTSGGICNISDGVYRVDLPDDAFMEGSDYVIYGGYAVNSIVLGKTIQLTDIEVEKEIFTENTLDLIANKVISKLGVGLIIKPTVSPQYDKFVIYSYPSTLTEDLLLNSAFLHLRSGTTSRITSAVLTTDGLEVTVSPSLLALPEDGDVIILFGKYLENL